MKAKENIINCPQCGSVNVAQKKQPGYAVMLSLLLLGLPLPIFKKRYFCFDCRNEWKIHDK